MKTPNLLLIVFVFALSLLIGCGSTVDGIASYGSVAGSGGATLAITPTTLPDGVVGAAYSQTLTSTGTGPFVWSVASGFLPNGLTISAANGIISGTPTIAGTYSFTVQSRDSKFDFGSQSLTIIVYNALIISTTSPLPSGTTGTAYSQTLAATGGQAPYTWAITLGTLHADFALNSLTGAITGTPTVASSSSFTIQVTDAAFRTTTRAFILDVYDSLTITTATPLPEGTKDAAYSLTLAAAGGATPYTWALASGSTLPAGLSLSSGSIFGTPTTASTFFFTIEVSDAAPTTVSKLFSLTVRDVLTITTTTITAAEQGKLYGATLAASGGLIPYTWTLTGSSGSLPTGLTLNANGTITGTTTAGVGDYPIEVMVTDSGARTDTQALTLTLNPGITLAPTTLPAGTAGTVYSQILTASGGTPDYSCTISNGALPNGLLLATVVPNTCTINGTPTVAGTFNFQVTATDSFTNTGYQNYSVVISLGMSTTTLPDASVATGAYSQDLTTLLLGETGATTWTLTGGALPLNGGWALSSGGLLTGTADVLDEPSGPFSFTVQVTDSATSPNTASFTLSVDVVP